MIRCDGARGGYADAAPIIGMRGVAWRRSSCFAFGGARRGRVNLSPALCLAQCAAIQVERAGARNEGCIGSGSLNEWRRGDTKHLVKPNGADVFAGGHTASNAPDLF